MVTIKNNAMYGRQARNEKNDVNILHRHSGVGIRYDHTAESIA